MKHLLIIWLLCMSAPYIYATETDMVYPQDKTEQVSPGNPRIKFVQSIIDVGTVSVSKGKRQKFYFEYVNTGNAPLIITSAESGCGCTQPQVKQKPVKPGKSGKLLVVFDPTNLDDRGTFGTLITVYVNGSQNYVRIRLVGKLVD